MEKDSALYQLMVVRMNGIMNDITNSDGEYQEIVRKSNEYSGRLERIGLPVDIRLLIDDYISEQNALVSRYGMLAYLLGFSFSFAYNGISIFSIDNISIAINRTL